MANFVAALSKREGSNVQYFKPRGSNQHSLYPSLPDRNSKIKINHKLSQAEAIEILSVISTLYLNTSNKKRFPNSIF
ncbi:hypothetical protein ASF92_08180 [Pedobacter sp. Leaf176]|nr:hypothetical protein ASF92_08180 [Pedobacter sp. Leaf176]